MKKNKVWIAILIIGICSVITGLIQLLFQNIALTVWLTNLGVSLVILALLQKKREDHNQK